MGSPEGEFGRGLYNEDLTQTTLTRPFMVQQFELTQREWTAFGLSNPSTVWPPDAGGGGDGSDPLCPVGNTSWMDVAAFANLLSDRHRPTLPRCYDLAGCTASLGNGMTCTGVSITAPTIYDCRGFRMLTAPEWEYAARAGTRTTYYDGDFSPSSTYSTTVNGDEPRLDGIAWYRASSGTYSHAVGRKPPNSWGLYDVLGNAFEWVHTDMRGHGLGVGPLVDPGGELVQNISRQFRGGGAIDEPEGLRAACQTGLDWTGRGPLVGFRLALTGTTNPGSVLSIAGVTDAGSPSGVKPASPPDAGALGATCSSRYTTIQAGDDFCDYSGSGLVKDTKTGLTWTRQEYAFHMGQSQPQASSHCQSLGMRLPTKDEALAIAGSSFESCAFPCTWGTFTSTSAGSHVVWHVNYDGSSATVSAKDEGGGFVMCVK
jgi:formylglycine-generating enzyme required for sulfatase activity